MYRYSCSYSVYTKISLHSLFLYMLNLWLPCPYAQSIVTVFVMGTEAAVMILNIMTIENIRQQLIVFMRCRPARQMQYVTIVPHRQQ